MTAGAGGTPEFTDPEDRKLVTLARATRGRAGTPEGAALRDLDGRTYAAATVDLADLQVSAVGAALGMAVASAAGGLEAVVVLGDRDLEDGDVAAVRALAGGGVPVYRTDLRGSVCEVRNT